ncbi:MAG: energy transducer TonB [Burkholderiales bacterium]|nr:energy transducer TonB [Burkholderiales bacterium]
MRPLAGAVLCAGLAAGTPHPAAAQDTAAPRPARIQEVVAERVAALQLYQLKLVQTGMSLRRYPEEALREGLHGTAAVEIRIGADGKLTNQRLVKSTGHKILDQHALALIAQAVPRTELPAALQNTVFTMVINVAFVLPGPRSA